MPSGFLALDFQRNLVRVVVHTCLCSFRSSTNSECKSERSSPALPKEKNLGVLEALGSSTDVVQQPKRSKGILVEMCPTCNMGFENVTDLLMHANEVHKFGGTVKQEVFPNYAAFEVRLSDLIRMFSK